jgi:hypothetical protein
VGGGERERKKEKERRKEKQAVSIMPRRAHKLKPRPGAGGSCL